MTRESSTPNGLLARVAAVGRDGDRVAVEEGEVGARRQERRRADSGAPPGPDVPVAERREEARARPTRCAGGRSPRRRGRREGPRTVVVDRREARRRDGDAPRRPERDEDAVEAERAGLARGSGGPRAGASRRRTGRSGRAGGRRRPASSRRSSPSPRRKRPASTSTVGATLHDTHASRRETAVRRRSRSARSRKRSRSPVDITSARSRRRDAERRREPLLERALRGRPPDDPRVARQRALRVAEPPGLDEAAPGLGGRHSPRMPSRRGWLRRPKPGGCAALSRPPPARGSGACGAPRAAAGRRRASRGG